MDRPIRSKRIAIGDRTYDIASDDTYLDDIGTMFEPTTVDLLDSLVAPGDVVLDVGANIGCTALLFAQRAAVVHAFEPGRGTFEFLVRNVESAGCTNIVSRNVALGRHGGVVQLVAAVSNRSGAFVSDLGVPRDHVAEDVQVVTGDGYVEANVIARVDIVKIDTEGYELEVLAGMSRTIARDRPVVTLELNHWCLNAFRRVCVPDFLDDLRAVFPVLYAVDDREALDLHRPDLAHVVMHEHIVNSRFPAIVGAFGSDRLETFLDRFVHGPAALRELDQRRRALELEVDRLRVVEERVERAHDEPTEAVDRIRWLEAELAAMRRTLSWRITRPLRAVRRRVPRR